MDQQLIAQITQRAGISTDQATQAAQAVVDFLKQRLPGPLGAQLDSVLGGQAGTGGAMGNMPNMPNMGNLGNTPNQIDQTLGGMTGGQPTQQP